MGPYAKEATTELSGEYDLAVVYWEFNHVGELEAQHLAVGLGLDVGDCAQVLDALDVVLTEVPPSALTTPNPASMSLRRYGRTMASFVAPSVMAMALAALLSSIAAWSLT
jgi:hypothetical protein